MAAKGQLYIEKRENGKYAIEREHGKKALALCDTQKEAIARAKQIDPSQKPHIARVREAMLISSERIRNHTSATRPQFRAP